MKLSKNIMYLFSLVVFMQSCSLFKPKKPTEEVTVKPIQPSEPLKPEPIGITDNELLSILKKDDFVSKILNNPKEYNTQIIYTQINRNSDNIPTFKQWQVNNDPKFYFYPASMIKMPLAFLALQKLNELNQKGIIVDKNSTMITETATPLQTSVFNDPTSADGRPSIAHYIKKIFLTSDNDASNRLYEFLGQEYINDELYRKGFKSAEILHRLSIALPFEENKITNPIQFFDANGKLLYSQASQKNQRNYSKRNDVRGVGYMSAGKKIDQPFVFSDKNRLSLADLHQMIKAIIFPEQVAKNTRFNISEEDRLFLLQYMSQLPSETEYPDYNPKEIWDYYVKFNLFGSEKKTATKTIRSFNKVGFAYGYVTDASYIVDFNNGVEFMLSVTIYANKDGIFNDDQYETDEIALPFMKKVGELIYQFEKNRKKNQADLSEFKITYDK